MNATGGWEQPTGERRRRWWALLAVLALAAAVAVAGRAPEDEDAGLVVEDAEEVPLPARDAEEVPLPARSPDVAPVRGAPEADGEWARAPEPPHDRWEAASAVWTGREVLVWGPNPLGYDPAAEAWRALPPPPPPRTRPATVWAPAGDGTPGRGELLVWGGRGLDGSEWFADGLAYDPTADAWRTLPDAPLSPRDRALAAWTGEEALVGGGIDPDGRPRVDIAAYDQARDAWRRLPDLPAPPVALEWADRQAIAVLLPEPGRPQVVAHRLGADGWRDLPDPPFAGDVRGVSTTVVEHPRGRRLALWRGGSEGSGRLWVFDHWAQRWDEAPPAPIPDRLSPALAWTPHGLLVWGGHTAGGVRGDGALYDLEVGAWRALGDPPGVDVHRPPAGAVWAGAEALVLAEPGGFVSWRPRGFAPLLADAPARRLHLAVRGGIAGVDLPSRRVVRRRVPVTPGAFGGPLVAVGDAVVFVAYPEVFVLPADGGEARPIGYGHGVVADPAGEHVWLVEAGPDEHSTALRPVSLDGGSLGPARTLPGWVHGLTAHGVVLSVPDRGFVISQAGAQRPVGEVDEEIVGIGRDHVATCRGACRQLRVVDLVTGDTQDLDLAHRTGFPRPAVVFSVDDAQLAAIAHRLDGVELAVVDLADGAVRRVPLGRFDLPPHLAWDPAGRWVYVAGDGRLLAVPPDAQARLVTDDLPDEVFALAVTTR